MLLKINMTEIINIQKMRSTIRTTREESWRYDPTTGKYDKKPLDPNYFINYYKNHDGKQITCNCGKQLTVRSLKYHLKNTCSLIHDVNASIDDEPLYNKKVRPITRATREESWRYDPETGKYDSKPLDPNYFKNYYKTHYAKQVTCKCGKQLGLSSLKTHLKNTCPMIHDGKASENELNLIKFD